MKWQKSPYQDTEKNGQNFNPAATAAGLEP
jgi:hypothetical protein